MHARGAAHPQGMARAAADGHRLAPCGTGSGATRHDVCSGEHLRSKWPEALLRQGAGLETWADTTRLSIARSVVTKPTCL